METKKIIELFDLVQEISRSGLTHKIECLEAAEKELFKRLPFKKGDKVKLKKTPIITKEIAPGWNKCKHFLKKGALATVESVSVSTSGINYYLTFDNETWLDHEGKGQPVQRQHIFNFSEDYISRRTK